MKPCCKPWVSILIKLLKPRGECIIQTDEMVLLARQKYVKKRSVYAVHEYFERIFNNASTTLSRFGLFRQFQNKRSILTIARFTVDFPRKMFQGTLAKW